MFLNKYGNKIRELEDITNLLFMPTGAKEFCELYKSRESHTLLSKLHKIATVDTKLVFNFLEDVTIYMYSTEEVQLIMLRNIFRQITESEMLNSDLNREHEYSSKILEIDDRLEMLEFILAPKPENPIVKLSTHAYVVVEDKNDIKVYTGMPIEIFTKAIPGRIVYTCAECDNFAIQEGQRGTAFPLNEPFYFDRDRKLHLCPSHATDKCIPMHVSVKEQAQYFG